MMDKETYRGITFYQTESGHWIFGNFLPTAANRWGSWSRFVDWNESGAQAMRNAIDRAYDDNPVYRGDLRDRK